MRTVIWKPASVLFLLSIGLLNFNQAAVGEDATAGQTSIPRGANHKAAFSFALEPEQVPAGGTMTLRVRATVDREWHVYPMEGVVVNQPTVISLEGIDGLRLEGKFEANPAPTVHFDPSNKTARHHEGVVEWTGRYRVPEQASGKVLLRGQILFQTCRGKVCLPPTTLKFQHEIYVQNDRGANPGNSDPPAASPTDSEPAPLQTASPPATPAEPGAPAEQTEEQATALIQERLGVQRFKVYPGDTQVTSIGGALALGFLAGIILNVMPCVLPVVSLKIYGFVQQAGEDRGRVRLLGLTFGLGILTVFLILAAFTAAMGVGWGEQFQQPSFAVGMIALVVLFTLGMFEVYTIQLPGSVSALDSQVARKEGLVGSYCKGMLATVLATPCTGPFLGATLAYAVAQPAPVIFAIYAAIGLGMAFPYVVLAWQPQWMKLMPAPGEWMNTLKHLMGFLLFGTALWLLWQRRSDGELVVWTVGFCLFVAFGAWVYGRWSTPWSSARQRWAAPFAAVAIMVLGGYFCFGVMYSRPEQAQRVATIEYGEWRRFDLDQFLAARQQGKTVVVDWTADW